MENYVRRTFPNITDDHLAHMLQLYPDVPSQGAPYDTGDEYQLFPQYKRIGSLACDILFDSNHRLYAQNLATHNRDVWSYCERSALYSCKLRVLIRAVPGPNLDYQRNFVYGFGVVRSHLACCSIISLPFGGTHSSADIVIIPVGQTTCSPSTSCRRRYVECGSHISHPFLASTW